MPGKKGMKHYSREVKLEAVRLFTEEGKSQAEIIAILGINNVRRVKQWLHAYRQEGEQAFEAKQHDGLVGRPPKRENTEAYIARLEMENDLLKKFHAELRKLELAKRNIGSSITKKKHTK
ncbi:MAG TPA: helix-turn-helix domain-containing protein [Anaerolineales bacterium]|nr:helix-turn-helix domain-containing protein [Anaerolineales bacterium]